MCGSDLVIPLVLYFLGICYGIGIRGKSGFKGVGTAAAAAAACIALELVLLTPTSVPLRICFGIGIGGRVVKSGFHGAGTGAAGALLAETNINTSCHLLGLVVVEE